jgi:hypothetical protein
MAHVLEGKSIGLDQKIVLTEELLIWRIKNQARDQRSNSKIQFASNHSKLVPRKLNHGPSSKVGLSFNPSFEHLHYCYRYFPLLLSGQLL